MEKLICNPYLPGKEYVPDGEPYIFDDRLYIFGSHDEFEAETYCTGSYVGWSAPLSDLGDWRYEGVILEKGQDPLDQDGTKQYYAPDVTKGTDGRYYLYYSIEGSYVISVAVSNQPAGKYVFYGHVKDKEGHILGENQGDPFQFDPAVLVDDDGRIYLYSGQGMPVPEIDGRQVLGALVCELDTDMLTCKTEQKVITSRTINTFEENPFFEASSIRKIGGTYYFIYSPLPNVHTLCYATSRYPDREFKYQGVIISNGGMKACKEGVQKPEYYWGNNHGSILEMDYELYIFYHRHTNKSSWCRQGCVEHLVMENGKIEQVNMSSMGMRKEPFLFQGEYPAYISCILKKQEMDAYIPFQFLQFTSSDPFVTQEKNTEIPFVSNLRNGSTAGYRYFRFYEGECNIKVTIRGIAEGKLCLWGEKQGDMGHIQVCPSKAWTQFQGVLQTKQVIDTLYLTYFGTGSIDIVSFEA